MAHADEAALFNKDEAKVNWHDKALWFVRNKRDNAAHTVKGWEELRNLASGIKANVMSNLDNYLIQFEENAKKNGVTKTEMAEILTHLDFYVGWPNAWSAFRVVKEVYADDTTVENHGGMFGIGEANTAYAKYFIGNSYLKPLTNPNETVFVANVTFEPGCRKLDYVA